MIIAAGLWPFSFWPRNEVRWLSNGDGLRFDGGGIVYGSSSIDISRLFRNKSITVELRLEPDTDANWHGERNHWHYAQILSLYDVERRSEVFSVGQWSSSLNIRNSFIGPGKYRKIGLGKVLEMGSAPFLTITSDEEGTAIFVDGRPVRVYPDFNLVSYGVGPPGTLIIGNSPSGKDPWSGKIFGLAFYDRRLTEEEVARNYMAWSMGKAPGNSAGYRPLMLYRFNEGAGEMVHDLAADQYDLRIPAALNVLERPGLMMSWRGYHLNKSFIKDVVINVLGFMPLGFLVVFFLSASTGASKYALAFFTIIIGAGTSLAIESSQVYLLTRTPSFIDLGCNVLGTVLGMLALFVLSRNNLLRRLH
jgi:hypothetical protein